MQRSDRTCTLRTALLLVVAAILGACATTRAVNEWQDEAYSGKLDSLLIIAATDDGALRRNAEDAYVARLAAIGIAAVPGYALIADAAAVSRATVEAAIAGKDIDAVLVTRLLGIEEIEEYQPPIRVDYYRSYYRYHAHAMDMSNPGYYIRYKLLTLETMLYDTATGDLIWSMQSEAIDSDSPQSVIDGQIALAVERLQARGLLAVAGG